MDNWNKISLYRFQQIDAINAKPGMSDIDKALFSACIIFNLTESQMNEIGAKKAMRLLNRTERIFSRPLKPGASTRIGKYLLNYDLPTLSFGQFIDLSFFLQSHIQNAHYALASISRTLFKKYSADHHRRRADYFMEQGVEKIMGCLALLIERYRAFLGEYAGLFGLDAGTHGDAQGDVFNKRYGWIYSASQVAEYERITLEAAYALPVRQAFNDLAYLKAKSKYEAEQLKSK